MTFHEVIGLKCMRGKNYGENGMIEIGLGKINDGNCQNRQRVRGCLKINFLSLFYYSLYDWNYQIVTQYLKASV